MCHRLCSGKRPYFEVATPRRLSNTAPFRVWRCLFVGRRRNSQPLRSRGVKTPFQRKAANTTATKRLPCSLFTSTAPSGSRHPFPKSPPLTPAQPHFLALAFITSTTHTDGALGGVAVGAAVLPPRGGSAPASGKRHRWEPLQPTGGGGGGRDGTLCYRVVLRVFVCTFHNDIFMHFPDVSFDFPT